MPLFFFDVQDDDDVWVDREGTELHNYEAAQAEAIQAMAEFTCDRLPGRTSKHVTMTVRDEAGNGLFELELDFAVRQLVPNEYRVRPG